MSGRFKTKVQRIPPRPPPAPIDPSDPKAREPKMEEVNPHIPKFIAKAPWYMDTGSARGLEHQRRALTDKEAIEISEQRGVFKQATTKYRKGACENCGSMTHKVKDCLERPRKKGAKWSGVDIKADETIVDRSNVKSFDAKRDRWIGYDTSQHLGLLQEWELVEEERKRQKEKEVEKMIKEGKSAEDQAVLEAVVTGNDDKYADMEDMPGQKVDMKARMTIRNLRLREDTAKYLKNLDPNASQLYDPKTRSMRSNPKATKIDPIGQEDLFVRYTGEMPKMKELHEFAWSAYDRGSEIHAVANPSQAELVYKDFKEKTDQLKKEVDKALIEEYGEQPLVDQQNRAELLPSQTEVYVEYTADGSVKKPAEPEFVRHKARFREDADKEEETDHRKLAEAEQEYEEKGQAEEDDDEEKNEEEGNPVNTGNDEEEEDEELSITKESRKRRLKPSN